MWPDQKAASKERRLFYLLHISKLSNPGVLFFVTEHLVGIVHDHQDQLTGCLTEAWAEEVEVF